MDKEKLIEEVFKTERKYAAVFSEIEELEYGIRYTDNNLPGMYCHNFLRLNKEDLAKADIAEGKETLFRKNNAQDVVQIEVFNSSRDDVEKYFDSSKLSVHEVLFVEAGKFADKSVNSGGAVRIAETNEDFEIGKEIDCLSFDEEIREFVSARYDRKRLKYQDDDERINNFICCDGDEIIGNCDFYYDGHFGKIEDFDVLDRHQRRGYGTAILSAIRTYAKENGVKYLFLQVDKENSAAEMYRKLGFSKLCENIIYFNKLE